MADFSTKEIAESSQIRQRHHEGRQIEIVGPDGQHRKVAVTDLTQDDSELATRFGYNPVFKREFGYLSTFSFAVSISGLFATIMTTFSYPLLAGGSNAAVWCWFVSGFGCMCIAVGANETAFGPYLDNLTNGGVVLCCRTGFCLSHLWRTVRLSRYLRVIFALSSNGNAGSDKP